MNPVTEAKRKYYEIYNSVDSDPEVVAARKAYDDALSKAKARIQPQVDAAYKVWMDAQNSHKPKSRWPENTPEHVLNRCKAHWRGTTEFHTFRIHAWNDKAVVTSYPGGKWSDNGGSNYGQACYNCISLTELDQWKHKLKVIDENMGRASPKRIQEMLAKALQ